MALARNLRTIAFVVYSLVAGVLAVELLARVWLPDTYYVWPPGFHATFTPDPLLHSGIEGTSRLTINSFGVRGDPFLDTQEYRLLAVGGSTTICTTLGDAEAWPYLAQRKLNEALGPGRVWFGNVGRPGHTTGQHIPQVEKLLGQHPEIDAVVLLVGINDMHIYLSLSQDRGALASPRTGSPLGFAFSVIPGWEPGDPWYRRTGIARLIATRRWRSIGQREGRPPDAVWDDQRVFVVKALEHRRRATSFIERLPDLSRALNSYEKNLDRIIDIARAHEKRVIFITQPTLWRDDLSPEEADRLWMGGPPLRRMTDDARFYSVDALATAMRAYNDALRGVCRERSVECLDAARLLPRNGTIFWDDSHYTEEGSRQLAGLVADFLLARPPLSGMRRSNRRTTGDPQ